MALLGPSTNVNLSLHYYAIICSIICCYTHSHTLCGFSSTTTHLLLDLCRNSFLKDVLCDYAQADHLEMLQIHQNVILRPKHNSGLWSAHICICITSNLTWKKHPSDPPSEQNSIVISCDFPSSRIPQQSPTNWQQALISAGTLWAYAAVQHSAVPVPNYRLHRWIKQKQNKTKKSLWFPTSNSAHTWYIAPDRPYS